MKSKTENRDAAGQLKPKEWVTIYAHAVPARFFVQLFGSIPESAKLLVEIDDTVYGTLTQKNPSMHANGKKIRLNNAGKELQVYNYYPA